MFRKIIILVALLFFFAFLPSNVSAKILTNEKGTVSIPSTEVVDDDLFVAAKSVEINGTINHDVFIGAEDVWINGTINGNLHVGAGNVNISGAVKGNVYIGAGQINISDSKIEGSLLVGTNIINIDDRSSVAGSILIGAGTANISSSIGRNLYIGAGNIEIDSVIGGEGRIAGGKMHIGKNTKIAGDFYYIEDTNQQNIYISDEATVAGQIYKKEYRKSETKNVDLPNVDKKIFSGVKGFLTLASFMGALLVGYVSYRLFFKHLNISSEILTKSFWKSLGVGFAVAVCLFPLLLLLAITGIGIPLAGMLFILSIIYMYLAKIVVGFALGQFLARKFKWEKLPKFALLAIGLLLIYVIKSVSIIGFFVSLLVLCSGLGSQLLKIFSKEENT